MRSLILLFVFMAQMEGAFSYYRSITVNHLKVSTSDQSNFPVLVSGTYSYLATEANGGKVKNANGYDIGFYSNTDCSTGKLDWETSKYTATTGEVIYWVRIPTLSSTVDTVFYLCYADAGISTDQSNKTGVYDANYKGVWHLSDGTTLTATDSTSNADNGTITGATATTGPTYLDGAANFADNTQYIQVTGRTFANAQPATISCWVYVASLAAKTIIGGSNNALGSMLGIRLDSTGHVYGTRTGFSDFTKSTGTITAGVWNSIAFVWDGSGNITYYINGANAGTATTTQNPTQPTDLFGKTNSYTEPLVGKLDEVRFSFTNRSAGWIATEYNSESDPTTFYTVGTETPLGGGALKVARGQII